MRSTPLLLALPLALVAGCAHKDTTPQPVYGRSGIPFRDPQPTMGTQPTVPQPMMSRPETLGEAHVPVATDVNNSLGSSGMAPGAPTTVPQAVAPVPTPSVRVASEPLDDEKILNVTHVANAGEIELAKLAQARATDARVRQLADMIVRDHGQAAKKTERVARESKLSRQESGLSEKLRTDNRLTLERLETKTGPEFDRAYVAAQVDAHRQVLEIIDHTLLPNATSSDVKHLVQSIRPSIAHHYQEAKALKDDIEK